MSDVSKVYLVTIPKGNCYRNNPKEVQRRVIPVLKSYVQGAELTPIDEGIWELAVPEYGENSIKHVLTNDYRFDITEI